MIGHSPAVRRYNRRVLILSLIYAIALFAAVYGFKRELLHGPVAWVAALLPAAPIVGIIAAIGHYLVEEHDEYLREQVARQSLIATGFTLSIATAWGFLESFGLVPHVYAYYAVILWFAGLGVGACVIRLRARGEA